MLVSPCFEGLSLLFGQKEERNCLLFGQKEERNCPFRY
jgi:hypothetical protein